MAKATVFFVGGNAEISGSSEEVFAFIANVRESGFITLYKKDECRLVRVSSVASDLDLTLLYKEQENQVVTEDVFLIAVKLK